MRERRTNKRAKYNERN